MPISRIENLLRLFYVTGDEVATERNVPWKSQHQEPSKPVLWAQAPMAQSIKMGSLLKSQWNLESSAEDCLPKLSTDPIIGVCRRNIFRNPAVCHPGKRPNHDQMTSVKHAYIRSALEEKGTNRPWSQCTLIREEIKAFTTLLLHSTQCRIKLL